MKTRLAGIGLAVVLAAVLFVRASDAFPYQFGIDFYQFWGIPTAHKSLAPESPYADPFGYAQALNRISDASDSVMLRNANRFYRTSLVPMATPFFNASVDFLPADYERARILHTALLFLAAGLGVFMLARLRGIAVWPAVCIALAVELTFNPFVQDVKVGNVNSLQLLYLAAVLYVAVNKLYSKNALIESLFLGSLAAFVIFKPNTVWIALALAIHYGIVRGPRKFLRGAGAATVVSVLAFAYGAWYFHDANVWWDWYRCAQGMNGGVLSAPFFEGGNHSLSAMLARHSMSYGPLGYSLLIALALVMAFIIAMSSMGRRGDLLVPTALKCFADPWFALTIGIIFTFATSPMVWPHYHVFALIPIFWLFRNDSARRAGTWGAVICYCGLSTPLIGLLASEGYYGILQAMMLLSWIALIPGVFAYVAERHASVRTTP
jgi:hypothetical protein